MNVLIIGGTGVLSRDILARSISLDYDVIVVNRGNHKLECDVQYIIADIRNESDIKTKLNNYFFDVVVDFVSYTLAQLKQTFSIFENKCKQYIFISSCCVYRRDLNDFPIREDSPKPNPELPYGINKFKCEQFLQSTSHKCKYTIVRPYITYGDTRIPFALAPLARLHGTIIKRILNNKPLFIWKQFNRTPICTITHTKDFAIAFCGLFLNEKAFDTDVNIVGDEITSWLDVVKIIYNHLGKSSLAIPEISIKDLCEEFPNDSTFFKGDRNLDAIFDNSKIKSLVPDFKQSIFLDSGIKSTIEYYISNECLDGIDYEFDAQLDRLLKRSGFSGLGYRDYLGNTRLIDRIRYYIYSTFPYYKAKGIETRLQNLMRRFRKE